MRGTAGGITVQTKKLPHPFGTQQSGGKQEQEKGLKCLKRYSHDICSVLPWSLWNHIFISRAWTFHDLYSINIHCTFWQRIISKKLNFGCDKVVLELVFILVPLSFETPFVLLCFVSLASQEELLGWKFLKGWLCFTFAFTLCQNVTFRGDLIRNVSPNVPGNFIAY